MNKRHVEKRGLISRERTKNILESAKSILQLAVKLLELWNNIREAALTTRDARPVTLNSMYRYFFDETVGQTWSTKSLPAGTL